MCYFSKENKRKNLKGIFTKDDLPLAAKAIFKQALKLQIGCGAEPSLFKYNVDLVKLGKLYKVPYISFTTNANLLDKESIYALLEAELDEFTISLHGVEKSTYEDLMQGANYEKFLEVIHLISTAKDSFPHAKLRINYTVNEQNIKELSRFFDVFKAVKIDILQVRPLQDIGGELFEIADQESFNTQFNVLTKYLKEACVQRKITYIAPSFLSTTTKVNKSSSIMNFVYCYISPNYFWRNDFDWRNETLPQYSKRVHYSSQLFKRIFSKKELTNDKLNYDVV